MAHINDQSYHESAALESGAQQALRNQISTGNQSIAFGLETTLQRWMVILLQMLNTIAFLKK